VIINVNLVAHGIDAVDIASFSRVVNGKSKAFVDRYFTQAELAAAGESYLRTEKLASRFATKEAVLKALGTGWGDGVAFTDVETLSTSNGAPTIMLHRKLVLIAREQGIVDWLVSSTHTNSTAISSVLALSEARS
jgi:holo-[acyl-carrier protein] synthase